MLLIKGGENKRFPKSRRETSITCIFFCPFTFSGPRGGSGGAAILLSAVFKICSYTPGKKMISLSDLSNNLKVWIFVPLAAVTKEVTATAAIQNVVLGCLRNCLQILCGRLVSPFGLSLVKSVAVFFSFSLTIQSRPPVVMMFIHCHCLLISFLFGQPGVTGLHIPSFGACVISFKSSISHRLFCLRALFSLCLPMRSLIPASPVLFDWTGGGSGDVGGVEMQ